MNYLNVVDKYWLMIKLNNELLNNKKIRLKLDNIIIIILIINSPNILCCYLSEKPSPCKDIECAYGECIVSKGIPLCVCPTKCDHYGDSKGSKPVCGSNGADYENTCLLQMDACKTQTNITIKWIGKCDPCAHVTCPPSQICQLDAQRNPICRCNSVCSDIFAPICASDGRTYPNECILRVQACRNSPLRLLYHGECVSSPCESLKCSYGECSIDRYGVGECTCGTECPQVMVPVCGTDGITYDSLCALKRISCLEKRKVEMLYRGVCGEDGACNGFQCSYGSLCSLSPDTKEPFCECPLCSGEYKPVCGDNGISYNNICLLKSHSCQSHTIININSTGYCKGCEDVKCDFYAMCQADGNGNGHCVCPNKCAPIDSPVCGSDGVTYENLCSLRMAACNSKRKIEVSSRGSCDICYNVLCKHGAKCENGECVCPKDCPLTFEPVCSNTGTTYVNECQMRTQACTHNLDLQIAFYGECQEVKGSNSIESNGGYINTCDPHTCRFGGVCDYDSEGIPHCVCSYKCPSIVTPICGSDGRVYENECKLQEEACKRQQDIEPQSSRLCSDSKLTPCDGDPPLVDPFGKEYSCEGNNTCPISSYCHKTWRFAKCCREGSPMRCSETRYGCCPDGVTIAGGPNNAGCPSICNCNKLGSYGSTCDPITNQCHCKQGVGGKSCDRCEPGYWGLHKISEGNSGCIPCACNMNGSIRDDCEQMTGRCVCKHGLQGIKCNICPEDTILDSKGCIHVSLTKTFPGTCADLTCSYGAVCRNARCVCDILCSSRLTTVCGSDGLTYSNECVLRLYACRMQRPLRIAHIGSCKEVEGVTHTSVRRSTAIKTTQMDARILSTQTTISTPLDLKQIMIPSFNGHSFMVMKRIQGYTRLSIEVNLTTYSNNGIILYNGQTASGEGDFVSLTINKGYIEFRYDLGSGKVILRSNKKISLSQPFTLVAKRYLKDGLLTLDGDDDVFGTSEGALSSLDLAEPLYIGDVEGTPKIYENIGTKIGFSGCLYSLVIGGKSIPLSFSTSINSNSYSLFSLSSLYALDPLINNIMMIKSSNVIDCSENICIRERPCNKLECKLLNNEEYECDCPLGYTSKECKVKLDECGKEQPCTKSTKCTRLPKGGFSCICEVNNKRKLCSEVLVNTFSSNGPNFYPTSSLILPSLTNVGAAMVIEVWILLRKADGGILYNGDFNTTDYIGLYAHHGYIVYEYNLGPNLNNQRTKVKISLGEWHLIRITRERQKGTLQIDDGPVTHGQAMGIYDELNVSSPLFIGKAPQINMMGIDGIIKAIIVNGVLLNIYGAVNQGEFGNK